MKNKFRSVMLIAFKLTLVAATTVAVTWALSASSEMGKRENVFTPDDKVKLAIAEPWWNYKDETGAVGLKPSDYPDTSDNAIKNIGLTSDVKGEELASEYLPGMYIPKNPKLYNTYTKSSDDTDNTGAEYVAMTVSYKVTIPVADAYTYLSGTNSQHWVKIAVGVSADNSTSDATFAGIDFTSQNIALNTESGNYVFHLTYAQFSDALATVYKVDPSSTVGAPASAVGFNTGSAANQWQEFPGFTQGSAFYYNGVLYAKNSGKLNDVNINPTSPLFSYIKVKAFDQEGETLTKADADLASNHPDYTESHKYKMTLPYKYLDGEDEKTANVDFYVSSLPGFDIEMQGFAIDANVSEFKSDVNILELSSLGTTPKANALDALKALIDKANS